MTRNCFVPSLSNTILSTIYAFSNTIFIHYLCHTQDLEEVTQIEADLRNKPSTSAVTTGGE